MIFLDSWIWLEFFQDGKKKERCKELLTSKENIIIDPLVLMEIKYRTAKLFGIKKSEDILLAIESFETLKSVPLFSKTAKFAADLRLKYYNPKRQLSYADCIHLATAINSGCKRFYSGDPDFKDIKEIDTVII